MSVNEEMDINNDYQTISLDQQEQEPQVSLSAQPKGPPQPLPQTSLLCKHYETNDEEFFDAAIQTLQTRIFNRTKKIIAALQGGTYFEREKVSYQTQTAAFHNEYQQSSREASIQPFNPILYGSDKIKGEYTLYANPARYETADQFFVRRESAVKLIQSCWRKYKAQKYCQILIQERDEKIAVQQQEELTIAAQKEKERQYQLKRRVQPRTKADFDLLYQEVATWVRQQKFSIDQANLIPEARQSALELLVQKESRLIQNIEALKRQTNIILRQDKIVNFFKKISEPRRWQLWDGSFAAVHTPYTLRAQSLRNIYYALEQKNITLDQRLDILLQTKFILKEFDCELTRNAVRLIDEEADLLSRNRPANSMEMLRKRILEHFLDFCESPEFNPGVLTLVKDSSDLIFRPNTLPVVDKKKLNPIKKEQMNRLKQTQIRKAVYSQLDQTKEKINMIEVLGELGGMQQYNQDLDADCQVDEPGLFLNILPDEVFATDGYRIMPQECEIQNEQSFQNDDGIGEEIKMDDLQ
ncbi:hypothetical protein SS50377_23322 [Spironucleus salmonicida]|uniref:IQ motif and ubiquitin-like domain-containing protein n=1 Tax=Spironucleus salmonicida TaxID=348837 RepID=V6LU34_9EUKA|nr:hypothetical protein SS50377_23322 [Spironucleus salmonicida]|eukprot:EST47191.1 Hypothetical protein SS50377_12701 [Spironucleus salmonicida]